MNHSTTGLAHPAADREGGVRMKKRAIMTVQRIRRAGMAAVLLAAASVGLSSGSAQARTKLTCRDYVHNLQMTAGLADRAAAMARRYDAAGDYNTASGYWAEYHIWLDEYDHWVQMSDRAGC
jgi:hypothetical protein